MWACELWGLIFMSIIKLIKDTTTTHALHTRGYPHPHQIHPPYPYPLILLRQQGTNESGPGEGQVGLPVGLEYSRDYPCTPSSRSIGGGGKGVEGYPLPSHCFLHPSIPDYTLSPFLASRAPGCAKKGYWEDDWGEGCGVIAVG